VSSHAPIRRIIGARPPWLVVGCTLFGNSAMAYLVRTFEPAGPLKVTPNLDLDC
jgi:hypothetical protein